MPPVLLFPPSPPGYAPPQVLPSCKVRNCPTSAGIYYFQPGITFDLLFLQPKTQNTPGISWAIRIGAGQSDRMNNGDAKGREMSLLERS